MELFRCEKRSVIGQRIVEFVALDSFDSAQAIGDNSTPSHQGGRLAQLGERRVRNAEVGGSIPPTSTNITLGPFPAAYLYTL